MNLRLLVAVALSLCLGVFGVACGPESFDRSRLDARADMGGGDDGAADAADDADAGAGEDAAPDAADEDAGDAGPEDDAADAGAGQGDAGDAADANDGGTTDTRDAGPADAGCTTTFGGDVLYAFDNNALVFSGPAPNPAGPLPPGWFAYPEPAGSAALKQSGTAWTTNEGHTCPGAMVVTSNFTVYGTLEKVMALINFNANWATPKMYVRMHAWVKITMPAGATTLDYLDGIQLDANTDNYMAFKGVTVSASSFADGNWHEIVLELMPPSYVATDIRQVGVQLIAKPTASASTPAPFPTTMYVDDIWLEF